MYDNTQPFYLDTVYTTSKRQKWTIYHAETKRKIARDVQRMMYLLDAQTRFGALTLPAVHYSPSNAVTALILALTPIHAHLTQPVPFRAIGLADRRYEA